MDRSVTSRIGAIVVGLASALAVTACDEPARDEPARAGSSRSNDATSAPSAPARTSGAPAVSRAPASVATPSGPAPFVDAGAGGLRGGNWARCSSGFTVSGTPALDVMRLGLLCGPSNGMRKSPGGRAVAVAGDCFRAVAVGGAGVRALELVLLDARGARLASTTAERPLAVLEPDGAYCVAADGEVRTEARATGGDGPVAVELWRLQGAR
ncbi:MAG: hypothetical protein OZ921_02630 [Sorangiineae bacterium]|nr:hypothetical protein [Sorangiineae bacterium]